MINIHDSLFVQIFFGFWPIIWKLIQNLKKSFPLVCRAGRDKLIDIKTLHFDQYSRLAIHFNIFWFSVINLKTNLKFQKSFPLVYRTQDESIDVKHQRFNIKTKSSYSFEDRGTDRQTDGRNRFWNVATLKDLSN